MKALLDTVAVLKKGLHVFLGERVHKDSSHDILRNKKKLKFLHLLLLFPYKDRCDITRSTDEVTSKLL